MISGDLIFEYGGSDNPSLKILEEREKTIYNLGTEIHDMQN